MNCLPSLPPQEIRLVGREMLQLSNYRRDGYWIEIVREDLSSHTYYLTGLKPYSVAKRIFRTVVGVFLVLSTFFLGLLSRRICSLFDRGDHIRFVCVDPENIYQPRSTTREDGSREVVIFRTFRTGGIDVPIAFSISPK